MVITCAQIHELLRTMLCCIDSRVYKTRVATHHFTLTQTAVYLHMHSTCAMDQLPPWCCDLARLVERQIYRHEAQLNPPRCHNSFDRL